MSPVVLPDYIKVLPFDAVAVYPGALALSADGNIAAHIALDGTIVVWDARTLETLERIPAEESEESHPGALALNADGSLLAIGRFDSVVLLHSRREHKTLRELQAHTGVVSALAFSPNGRLLASGGKDATTYVWEVASGRLLHAFDSRMEGSGGGIPMGLGFSGDGRALLVNEWYSRHHDVARGTSVWDLDEGIEIGWRSVAPPEGDDLMRSGQALGANNWLLTYTTDDGLALEQLDSCNEPRIAGPDVMPQAGHIAETVAADPDGRWVAALGSQQLNFYATQVDAEPVNLDLPIRPIALVAHPNGSRLFALAVKETFIKSYEQIIPGVTAGALYAITLPESLRQWPAVVAKPDAVRCPPSASARKLWSYRLPDRAPTLPVIAAPVLTDEVRTKLADINFLGEQYYNRHFDSDDHEVTDVETGDRYHIVASSVERKGSDGKPQRFATPGPMRSHAVAAPGPGRIHTVAARNGHLAFLYANGVGEFILATGESLPFRYRIPDGCVLYLPSLSGDGKSLQFPYGCDDGESEYVIFNWYGNGTRGASGPVLGQFPARSTRYVTPDSRPNHLRVMDLSKEEPYVAHLPRQPNRDYSGNYRALKATISDDGRLVASASFDDGLVRVWDIDARRVVGEANVNGQIRTMAFDSTGRSLAVRIETWTEAGTSTEDVVLLDTSGQPAATKKNEQ